MLEQLKEFLISNNQTAIQALEGYKKTRMVLGIMLMVLNYKNNELGIVSCKSYELLKEKQKEILKMLDSTDENLAPIISASENDNYKIYYTNKNKPWLVPKEARLILMTQKAIQQCHHINRIQYEQKKFIKWIFVDEFDSNIGVVPSLHYLWNNFTKENYFLAPEKTNKKDFLKFLQQEYSMQDFWRIKNLQKEDIDEFFIAHWIEVAEQFGIKVTFATSELLAIKLLEEVGFNTMKLSIDEETQLKLISHKIHTYPSDSINTFFYDRLNSKNLWGIFGFKTIVSDKYDGLTGSSVDIKVVNHTSVRGTNSLAGEDMLTIISYIPRQAIKKVQDTLNYFNKSANYTYEEIEKLFYRDRIMQAVGRVIGFRGIWKQKEETWMIIHSDILNAIKEDVNKEAMMFPYEIVLDYQLNDQFKELEVSIREDKRIKKDETNFKRSILTERITKENSKLIEQYFIKEENSKMTYAEIKEICQNNAIINYSKNIIQPGVVANYFGLTPEATSIRENGKTKGIRIVNGLGVKK